MPKPQKYRDVITFLRSQGWVLLRQGRGSHEIWGDPNDPRMRMTLAAHKEVSPGLIGQIVKAFPGAPRNWR